MFSLHERLKADTLEVVSLGLCRVLLMKDTLPWVILVPEREGIREIHELARADRAGLMEETALASRIINELFSPDKINIGVLGNIVPQLHIHVIGRFKGDRAWPGPVWGRPETKPFSGELLSRNRSRLKEAFKNTRA